MHFFQAGNPPVTFASSTPASGIVRAQRFNDVWASFKTSFNADRWQSLRAGIIMFSFAQDMFEGAARFAVEEASMHDGAVFVHAPMGADPTVFFADDDGGGKTANGVLAGSQDPYCYPMRNKASSCLASFANFRATGCTV